MPSAKTPSFVCAAEYLGDELYASYCRLKQHYKAAAPHDQPALLSRMGLSAMLCDEATALHGALEIVEFSVTEQDTHAELAKVLKRYSAELGISSELADYIQCLPAKEHQRGTTEAEALRKQPKSKARKKQAVEVAPDELPAHYEAAAKLVQPLLALPQVIAKAWSVVEERGQIPQLGKLLGSSGPCFSYPDSPASLLLGK